MIKEKTLKSSKFTECYNELRSNENLRDELSKLSGSKLKAKLTEIFPTIDITGHFMRMAREILKESIETNSDSSTNNQNVDSLEQDSNEKFISFNEVASDKENDSTETINDKESNIAETIPFFNKNEYKKESNNSYDDLALTANNKLNKMDSTIIAKNKVTTIDESIAKSNILEKESANKDLEIELLKSQLIFEREKNKSISMTDDEKKKQILEIQNSYPPISADKGCIIIFHPNMIHDLKIAYASSKVVDTDLLFKTGANPDDYSIKNAVSEAIFNYRTKS